MAIFFDETDDYFIINDAASMTLPDSDWCVAVWTKVDDNAGSDAQYMLSNNTYGANNSFNLALHEAGSASAGKWEMRCEDGAGDAFSLMSTSAPGADGAWRLIVIQRVTNTCQMWFCAPGGSAVLEDSEVDASVDVIDGADWHIASRNPQDGDRMYGGIACEFFKADFSLSQAEIEALAAGLPVCALGKSPDVYLPMTESVATLYDLFGSNNAARQSAPTTVEHAPVGTLGWVVAVGVVSPVPVMVYDYRRRRV